MFFFKLPPNSPAHYRAGRQFLGIRLRNRVPQVLDGLDSAFHSKIYKFLFPGIMAAIPGSCMLSGCCGRIQNRANPLESPVYQDDEFDEVI